MYTNYPAFVEYHYYIKKWLKKVFQLERITNQNLEIPVIYSTPRRAFAMGGSELETGDAGGEPLYALPSEGNNWLPIVTFHMASSTPLIEKTYPYEHVLLKSQKDNNDNVVGYLKNKEMLPYEISYNLTFYTGLMQDADILSFRLATEFRPQCYLWIGPEDYMNDFNYGLWAQMVDIAIVDATEYEPGNIAERVVRKDVSWKITEAYLPTTEPELDENIIKYVYTDIYHMNEGIIT